MKATYLFDFDGTLVDSMPTFVAIMLRILDEEGIPYGEDIVNIITPLGYHGTAEYFRTLGVRASTESLIARMNAYALSEYRERILAKEGVAETLRALRAQGASLNVLTASPHAMLDPCLMRLGLFGLFDHVWSCDDFSTTKADPAIYKMAADALGTTACEVIFVDDNLGAISTAKAAGMRTFGIYDPSSHGDADKIRAVAERYLLRFDELLG